MLKQVSQELQHLEINMLYECHIPGNEHDNLLTRLKQEINILFRSILCIRHLVVKVELYDKVPAVESRRWVLPCVHHH